MRKILFNCSLSIFTFKLHALFALPFSINITTSPVINFLSFDNDGMKLSKRRFFYIVNFVLKCMSKSILITKFYGNKIH